MKHTLTQMVAWFFASGLSFSFFLAGHHFILPHPHANNTSQLDIETHDGNDQEDSQLEEDHATKPPN